MERKNIVSEACLGDSWQKQSDDDYWGSAHTGFDFEDSGRQLSVRGSKFSSLSSSVKKNSDLNQYDLLRWDGLSEVAENKAVSEACVTFYLLNTEEEKQAANLTKNCNLFEFHLKECSNKTRLSASQVVNNMVFGLDYTLKAFKGRDEKIELLNAAVQSHDGNAILMVIMFLRRTLKKSLFQREIGIFPDAVNMYLSYLQEDHELDELTNMFLLLDKPEDAAMLKYDSAIMIQNSERRIKIIQNCLNTHFLPGTVRQYLRQSVFEHKMCIEDQLVLEDHIVSSEEDTTIAPKLFEELTGGKKLMDPSAMCCLIFCLLYFYNVAKIASISPDTIRNRYQVSQKQYTWCALRTLAITKRWTEIEDLFSSKNWLGAVKVRSCIGFIRVLDVLSKRKAPLEVMIRYICCIEDQELKLSLAKIYKCHSVVIEILRKNKDRLRLEEYKGHLPPHSIDYCYATSVLNNETVNWRN